MPEITSASGTNLELLSAQAARSLLAAIPAALYITDTEGRITLYNDHAAELWGRRPETGELWCGSWKFLNDDGSVLPHDQCPMAQTVRSGQPTLGTQIVVERPDGQRALVAPHPWPLRDAGGQIVGAINMLVDVTRPREIESALQAAQTDAKRLNQELVLQRRITQALAEADTLQEGANAVLRTVCEMAGAQVGCLWLLDGRASLRIAAAHSGKRQSFEEFVDSCRGVSIKIDEDVTGKVLLSRRPNWVSNLESVQNFRRREAAHAAGLRSVVVYPVALRGGLPARAAIELYFATSRERDPRLVTLLGEAALKLGTFIDRLEVEQAAIKDQQRLMVSA